MNNIIRNFPRNRELVQGALFCFCAAVALMVLFFIEVLA